MGSGSFKRGRWAGPLKEGGTERGVSTVGGACVRVTAGRGGASCLRAQPPGARWLGESREGAGPAGGGASPRGRGFPEGGGVPLGAGLERNLKRATRQ